MKINSNKTQGFTLVEIMIVVVIIGLLAAMAIPAFQKVRSSSQDKTVLNNARQLSAAADQYYLENGVSTVASANLVGATAYVKVINTVANETSGSRARARRHVSGRRVVEGAACCLQRRCLGR